MAISEHLLTVEEFEQFADSPENVDRLLELVNGEIIEKMPTEDHGIIAGIIYFVLARFAHSRKLGRVAIEVRYRSKEDHHNARIPDVSFSSAKRPIVKEGSVPELPDLAVEVQSPNQSLKSLREKARYFIANGTHLFWLVIPSKQLVEVYTAAEESLLTAEDMLTGGEVLPEFTLAVREIFRDPLDED